MASVATEPSRRLQILLRRARHVGTEIPTRLWRSLPDRVRTIGVLGIDNEADLADATTRMAWSAPDDVGVVMAGSPAAEQPSWAGESASLLGDRVTVGDPAGADMLVLATARRMRWVRRVVDSRVLIGDPNWYSGVEVESFVALSAATTTPAQWELIRRRSSGLLSELKRRYAGRQRVAVFGTGPSMTEVDPGEVGADVVVACNSVVSNREWLESAKPAVIAFGDPVFHFGPSRYASKFRDDLLRVARDTDAMFIVPERYAPLVDRRLPEVAARMITVAHSEDASLTDLHPDRLVVPQTANVLTLLMLPVALALGQEVSIAGCDGRKPDETYFWAHNPDVQYSDELMRSAFEAHPSFFRDRNYVRYYDLHCAQLEEMLSQAESQGHRFRSITRSEIPALRRRSP